MTVTTLLRSAAFLFGVCAFGVGCAARTEGVANDASEVTKGPAGPVEGTPPAPPTPTKPSVADASIFDVKSPNSRLAVGDSVRVSGAGVRVMGVSATTLYLQEAGDDGYCENGIAAVAYRAIAAKTNTMSDLAIGQRVEVTGVVAVEEGRRIIADVTVTPVAGDVRAYKPHCERDAATLFRPELEGVFVITAGTTDGTGGPQPDQWLLATCFGDAIRVGTTMTKYGDWSASWHSVLGIVVGGGAAMRLEPRSQEDIHGRMHDDVCL